MKLATGAKLVTEAWDLYADREFNKILEMCHGEDGDPGDLHFLASLEVYGPNGRRPTQNGLFSVLGEGMLAYHRGNVRDACEKLAHWLIEKSYYTDLILDRFFESARVSEKYDVLYKVSGKLLKEQNHKSAIAPYFHAAFALEYHQDAVNIFEKYREHFNDGSLLQKVAVSLIHTGRYRDAERILLALHKRITGSDYEIKYDQVKARYSSVIENLSSNNRTDKDKKRMTDDEQMELGMAYLFNGDYAHATQIFQDLLKMRSRKKN